MAQRVAIFAQDDSAIALLGPLAEKGCKVLAVGSEAQCPIFARHCVETGLCFALLEDARSAVEEFKPDLMVCAPAVGELPPMFREAAASGGPKKFVIRAGVPMEGAPWPEFAPIWLDHKSSPVTIAAAAGEAVAFAEVPLTSSDTAITLRAKHGDAAAKLLADIVGTDGAPKAAAPTAGSQEAPGAAAPPQIDLSWDEATVDRYVRAHNLPPHDAAVVADLSGETYFIESMYQYREFRSRVLRETSQEGGSAPTAYAADTHWYSNVGGSIVRMGDSDIHMPTKCADKKRKTVIPGAAMAGRKKLRMNEPLIGPNAERYCTNALTSGWIGVEGPHVRKLERYLAEITGCAASCAVQSGTAALYGAMKALGVSDPSHHVLVPAFTCAACADAVVHAGGKPIPVDCEMDSFGSSAEAVRRALEADKDVVGVVVAPCYGVPARDFHEISAMCRERGLWVCEDACESYGARQATSDGKVPVGSLSTLCVVSIRSEKMIGVGEGGAILGNDSTLVARAKWWCSRAPCRGVGLWRVYEHDAVGQNFRLPEMLAAVGCASAEMLPVMIERKRAIHEWYKAGFAKREELNCLTLQKAMDADEPVWWINAVLLPNGLSGEEVGMQLMKDYPDIEIRPGFSPLGKMEIFKSEFMRPCPNAEALYHGLVCLPSSNLLTEEDIGRVCDALAHALRTVTSRAATA